MLTSNSVENEENEEKNTQMSKEIFFYKETPTENQL